MLFKQYLSVIVITIFAITTSFSQIDTTATTPELSLSESTISDQFEYVIQKSTNWKDDKGRVFEVVRKQWLDQLKAHTLDSLQLITKKYNSTLTTIATQEKNIKALQDKLNNTQINLDTITSKKDEISLFGMNLSKAGYNSLLFSVIALLLGLLGFFVFKFKNSNVLTKAAQKQLTDVETEFDEHRRNALEREQKVRRKLQDEINKNKGK